MKLSQTSGMFRMLASWSVVTVAVGVTAGLRQLKAALPVEVPSPSSNRMRPAVEGFVKERVGNLEAADICPVLLERSSTSSCALANLLVLMRLTIVRWAVFWPEDGNDVRPFPGATERRDARSSCFGPSCSDAGVDLQSFVSST